MPIGPMVPSIANEGRCVVATILERHHLFVVLSKQRITIKFNKNATNLEGFLLLWELHRCAKKVNFQLSNSKAEPDNNFSKLVPNF